MNRRSRRLGPGAAVAVILAPLAGCGLAGSLNLPDKPIAHACSTEPLPKALGGAAPEDIAPDPHDPNLFYVSAARWAATAKMGELKGGAILRARWDEAAGRLRFENIRRDGPAFLHPHGIDLWVGNGGERRLFVVNHTPERSGVEIFSFEADGSLRHLGTAWSRKLPRPNDVVGLDSDTFLATNDHGWPARGWFRPGLQLIEDTFALPLAGVVLMKDDGAIGKEDEAVAAAANLAFANGVARSRGDVIYVSESTSGRIAAFRLRRPGWPRTLAGYRLDRIGALSVGHSPDNLWIDAQNRLWVTSHLSGVRLAAHTNGRKSASLRLTPSPSRVQSIDLTSNDPAPQTHYEMTAQAIGASGASSALSVGVPAPGGRLLLGSIFDGAVQVCRTARG